jgi:hypothetical protein
MIDDEFEVCFELMLSFMLAKRCLQRVPVRAYRTVPHPRGRETKMKIYPLL